MSLSVKPGRELVKRLVLAEVLARRGEGPLSLRVSPRPPAPNAPLAGAPVPPAAPPPQPATNADASAWSELSRSYAERDE